MTIKNHVHLRRHGRQQTVQIPREFELPGKEVVLRKQGDRLILETVPPRRLVDVLAQLSPIEEEFPSIIRERP